jgi:hypothetical protein
MRLIEYFYMITTVHTPDALRDIETLRAVDPFQLAVPCYIRRVYHQLPPETQTTVVRLTPFEELKKLMAIRTVEATAAPARLFKRGGISSKADYIELLAALNTAKPTQAFIVDMDRAAWEGVNKPEVAFANNLRRRFEVMGVPITAYMSAPFQITVRRLTALEQKEREAGKGKRKK